MQPFLVQSKFSELGEEFNLFLISICSEEHRRVWYKTPELYHLTPIRYRTFLVFSLSPLWCKIRSGQYPPKAEIQENSQKQNQDRARPLNKLSAIDTILHHQPFYDSLKVKKKHPYTSPLHTLASFKKLGCEVKDVFSNSFSNLNILYKSNATIVYNNDGILDFKHKSRFFMTSWDADSKFSKFKYLIVFFVESASLLLTRGKRETIHHLEAIRKVKKKKILRLWGKYVIDLKEKKRKKGEKNYRRNKGKKGTSYLTPTRNFCPPFSEISIRFFQRCTPLSQDLFFSPNTYIFSYPDHFVNQGYVLKPLPLFHRKKTVVPKIRKLGGILANAPTIQTCIWGWSY